jgi:rubrerythrin
MEQRCIHSCKGLCSALSAAQHREEEALHLYREYAAECDYPDVRELLNELIAGREQAIEQLRRKREELNARFDALDGINEQFA